MSARRTRTSPVRPSPPRQKQLRPPGEDARKLVRTARALELRSSGLSYRAIAAALGVSEFAAYYDVQDELGRLDPVIKKQAERLRDLEATRLDRLWLALQSGIKAGKPGAIMAAVRVMERRAKLFGLDAPTKVEMSDATTLAEKIQAARARGAQLAAERQGAGRAVPK